MMRYTPICVACALLVQAMSASAADATEGQSAPAAPAATAETPPAKAVQVVETFGRGQSRQVQNISHNDMARILPGSSPFKAMEKLPGVSFQSADAFGIYEWSTRISIRGFSQNQLGFTLDNIPLGDMSYSNHNGLHISRAVASENLVRISVSQGAGGLGTASTSNLGGTVQFVMQDPSELQTVTATETLGSDRTSRTFVRYDSGALGENGTTFFLSGVHQDTGKWKGAGKQKQDQFNSKIIVPLGDNQLSGFFNYSDRSEVDYQDLSLEMTRRLGYDWDNYAPDWDRALAAAKGNYTGAVNSLDDSYYLGQGLRTDKLGAATLDWDFGGGFTSKTSVYGHHNEGQGHWYTPYNAASPTMPISIRSSEYEISRHGLLTDLSWDTGMHEVRGGLWYEHSDHTFLRNLYAPPAHPGISDGYLTDPYKTQFRQEFATRTLQYYIQDTISMMNKRLKVNFGFKSPDVKTDGVSLIGSRAAGTIEAKKSFLPQVGAFYAIDEGDEVFSSVSQNMRAYQPGATGPFSQTQVAFDAGKPALKPETSITMDAGLRVRRDGFQGSVALYHTDFSDRQLAVAACSGIAGCPSVLVNVGKVATNGIEALGVWKLTHDLSWFNSVTYNDSKYKSDYLDNGQVVHAAGKQVVDAPKTMFATELTWENGPAFVRFGAKYTGERYYTFLNDAGVPAYTVATLSAGYKWKSLGFLKDLTLQLHVNNLFDKTYIATIGSNGFVQSDPTGAFQTLLTGAPRQMFVTVSGRM